MPRHHDLTREPCPGRILEDLGGAFGMGALGGFLWNFVKGARNSPRYERLAGGLHAGAIRAPTVGSSFAVWGGLYATFDCSLVYLRNGKEDSWNPVLSGAMTGGLLSLRSGWRSSAKNAAIGGVLLGIIEVVQLAFQRSTGEGPTPRQQYRQFVEMEQAERQAQEAAAAAARGGGGSAETSSFSSPFGRFFAGAPASSSSSASLRPAGAAPATDAPSAAAAESPSSELFRADEVLHQPPQQPSGSSSRAAAPVAASSLFSWGLRRSEPTL